MYVSWGMRMDFLVGLCLSVFLLKIVYVDGNRFYFDVISFYFLEFIIYVF